MLHLLAQQPASMIVGQLATYANAFAQLPPAHRPRKAGRGAFLQF